MAVEEDLIADSEELYRRIPVSSNWYDPSLDAPPSPNAFRPNAERDSTGLSVFRAKFITPEQVSINDRGAKYYVAVMKAGDLRDNKLTVVSKPVADQPGHAEIPELHSENRKTTEGLPLLLAEKLCLRVIGPFP